MPKLPNYFKTFEYNNLPPIARELYTEISKLSGIPITRLTPVHFRSKYDGGGGFWMEGHGVGFNRFATEASHRHELIHGTFNLVNDIHRASSRFKAPFLGFIEPIAYIFHSPGRTETDYHYGQFQFGNEQPTRFDDQLSIAQHKVYLQRIKQAEKFYSRRGHKHSYYSWHIRLVTY